MENSFSRLPKCVGMVVDPIYERPEYVNSFVKQLKKSTIVVCLDDKGSDAHIKESVLFRNDLFLKIMKIDAWEVGRFSPREAERMRDYMFLSYVKFHKGTVFFFPRKYERDIIAQQYTKKMRDLIILAHQMDIKYEIITVESQEG